MSKYFDQALPMPNPGDWMSRLGAADALGVSHQTIARMVKHGTLRQYLPVGRKANPMFWRTEVLQLLAARERANQRAAAAEA